MRFVWTLIGAFALLGATLPAQAPVKGPLAQLQKKTAWLLIGEIDNSDLFATTPSFTWAKKTSDQAGNLPAKGDRLRLLDAQELVIVDFKLKHEAKSMVSPTTLRRSLRDSDYTGLECAKDAVVEVGEVQLGPKTDGLREVWVRVQPPTPAGVGQFR